MDEETRQEFSRLNDRLARLEGKISRAEVEEKLDDLLFDEAESVDLDLEISEGEPLNLDPAISTTTSN